MKKYLALIILCSIIELWCRVRETLRDDAIERHSAGFKEGVECAEAAIKMGYPISYCYEALKLINEKLKKEL